MQVIPIELFIRYLFLDGTFGGHKRDLINEISQKFDQDEMEVQSEALFNIRQVGDVLIKKTGKGNESCASSLT